MKKSFSIREALARGFAVTRKEFPFFLKVFTIMSISYILFSIFISGAQDTAPFLAFLFKVASWVIYMMFLLGLLRIGLKLESGKKAVFWDLVSHKKELTTFILGSIMYCIAVVGGLILFIAPGIIIAIKLRFFPFVILEKQKDVLGGFEESNKMTKGNLVRLFLFYATLGILNLLGAAFFLVGLLVTVPMSLIASAYVYRKLS